MNQHAKQTNKWKLLPTFGILIFIGLYILAALLYPGGSTVNPTQKGFSLLHNYWCDLIAAVTKSGAKNTAEPVAFTAMVLVCLSLSALWFYLPQLFPTPSFRQKVIPYAGIAAMIAPLFLATSYHNTALNSAAFFGALALFFTFWELRRAGFNRLFNFGVFCAILCTINYYIYYTSQRLVILPLLQKVTFLICFGWLIWLNLTMYQKSV